MTRAACSGDCKADSSYLKPFEDSSLGLYDVVCMSVFFPLQGQHWTRIVTITGQFVPLTLSTSPYRSGILILLFMAMEFYCPDDLNISSHIKKIRILHPAMFYYWRQQTTLA